MFPFFIHNSLSFNLIYKKYTRNPTQKTPILYFVKNSIDMNTSKIGKIRMALSKLIEASFASITTDKGILYVDGDEVAVGLPVYVEDEEGNRSTAEDGEYKLDDNRILVVENGVIAEIKEPVAPEVEVEAPEVEIEAEEEVENPTNEGEESETEAVVELRKEVNELYQMVDALVKRVEAIEAKPAAEPAQEEFEKVKVSTVKDKSMKNLNRLFA